MSRVCYAIQDWRQLPAGYDWLNAEERARLDEFRFEKRQRDWLLGRWVAKIALLGATGLPNQDLGRVGIATAPDGAPLPMLDGRPCQARISISHSNGRALAAASMDADALGCDLELVEPRGHEFIETWFTNSEFAWVEQADPHLRDSLVTMIWSAKESTLKALRTGLRIDTRRVEVIEGDEHRAGDWNSVRVIADDQGEFSCLWQFDDRFILSIVTRSPAETERVPGFSMDHLEGAAAAPSLKAANCVNYGHGQGPAHRRHRAGRHEGSLRGCD